MSKVLTINIPKQATKRLRVQKFGEDKKMKLVISSNWLPLFGFEKDARVIERVIGANKGFKITLANKDDLKTKKVYSRAYKSRRNNPLETKMETQTDTRSQALLTEALGNCVEVHITFKKGELTIVPITSAQAERIKMAKSASTLLSAFVACSSGVDAKGLYNAGFRMDGLLEVEENNTLILNSQIGPQERRDKRDMTETGALCALNNIPFENLFNEDIFTFDTNLVKSIKEMYSTSLFSISTQCDDFSNTKAKSLKEAALCELTNTNDMVYDALRIIEAGKFPFVLLENVPPYMKSDYHTLFETRLRRLGYKVYSKIIDASEHGGRSKRKRAFVFATTFKEIPFSFPSAEVVKSDFWNRDVEPFLSECRDVTDCKSIQDGAKIGRLRVVTRESISFPTLLKSQSRQAKDSLVIEDKGRYLFPSEALERHMMGVPNSFSLETVGRGIGSEILGQAVEYISHSKLVNSIKEHISLVHDSFHAKTLKKQMNFSF